ncbi:MAG TPA: BTAD domain-containing putative transcriptional regulator, partial [Chloroflexia bacterium]|nr:BTAD domain-containing putative transcriptional regulator [Chloroflexia bacterium]
MAMQVIEPVPGIGSSLEAAAEEYERMSASLNALLEELAGGGSGTHLVRRLDRSTGPSVPADERVKARLFGSFGLSYCGVELESVLPGQAATILKYVLSQGRRHIPKDTLLELLWPEAEPDIASRRLRVVIHTLRRHLAALRPGGENLLLTLDNGYLLNPRVDIWTDVDEFERRRANGWRMHRAGLLEGAYQEFEQAEALYRGDYVEDEPYAEWTFLRRETLRDSYMSVLSMLAQISLEWEDYTGAIIWAQKLLAQDSCNEDAYRLLIASHIGLGQHNRAAHWYG